MLRLKRLFSSGPKQKYKKQGKPKTATPEVSHDIKVTIPKLEKYQIYKQNSLNYPSLHALITPADKTKNIEVTAENNTRIISPNKLYTPNLSLPKVNLSRVPNTIVNHLLQFNALILRESTADVINKLESGVKKILVDGDGKSVLLYQLVEYYSKENENKDKENKDKENNKGSDNKIIVYLPMLKNLLGGEYKFFKSGEFYDTPDLYFEFFELVKKTNPNLKNKAADIIELCNYGLSLNNPNAVGSDVTNTFKELMAKLRSKNTVFVVDMINAYFSDTFYRNTESQVVYAEEFLFCNEVLRVLKDDNCSVVVAKTGELIKRTNLTESVNKFNEFIRVNNVKLDTVKVDEFKFNEVKELLEGFKNVGFIKDEVSEEFVKKAKFVTGGRGRGLFEYGCYLPLLK